MSSRPRRSIMPSRSATPGGGSTLNMTANSRSSLMSQSQNRAHSPNIRPFRRLSEDLSRSIRIGDRRPGSRANQTHLSLSISPTSIGEPIGELAESPKSPQDWRRSGSSLEQRSNLLPPPVGSPTSTWGHFDTVGDILSRPRPLPPVSNRPTMAHYGGQFNPYNPISRLYETSRLAISSPGPGNYGQGGAPDPNLSNRGAGIGKTSGGRISGAVRETDADLMSRRGSKIPGPGHYDTDHIYGIYSRIMTATMDPSFAKSDQLRKHTQIFTADLEDTIFDQRLVMSRKIPVDSLMKLGSTRFSRLGKDLHPVKVRKLRRGPRPVKRSIMQEQAEQHRLMNELSGEEFSGAGSSRRHSAVDGFDYEEMKD